MEEAMNSYAKYCLINDIIDSENLNFELKKDIYDSFELTKFQDKENHYLINIQNNNIKRRRSFKEVESFNLLDIDQKLQIKNFSGFNYNKLNTTTVLSPDIL